MTTQNAAFEAGRTLGLTTDSVSKGDRKDTLRALDMLTSEGAESFMAGREAGMKERHEAEAPAKAAKAAKDAKIKAKNEALCSTIKRRDFRSEESHEAATRMRDENISRQEAPQAVLEAIENHLSD